ncbi:MarR family winged helix-turn-helix transcriptional regulator [Streptomyces pseudovenezuelae]|uniref:DNA-binding MarR family transcriptional regulator n=1 Tax=Streptomyces pseudovenezuelae TaxID=67350 RepID=A0ABT6LQJ3_9ACTN|nr:MarR family transcriptional regulator [Streptomyces pseudovenezuelae]MDH6218587.1 DNA-binding MarR family transcriptional regulator [Streptomyces pseudovenezuelae]
MTAGHLPDEVRNDSDEPLNTVDALVQLSFLVQGVLTRVAAAHDLSLVQVRLLGILRDRRPGMLELARHLGLDKSSMTGLVTRAEKRGLVLRVPSPHDGRGVLVSLTPAGRELAEEGGAEIDRAIGELAQALTAGERAQLRALAAKLLAAAPAGEAGRPPVR